METTINSSKQHIDAVIVLLLISLGVLLRVLPHPDNFAPVAAIAIFGGALLPRYWGVGVPLLAMIVSDMFIGLHNLIFVTWGCYALIAFVSHFWLRKRSVGRGTLMAIGSSIFFFVVTNFAVWAEGRLYSRTFAGLVEAYAMAIPFFRNTLASDLFYTGLLFSLYWLSQRLAVMQGPKIGIRS